MPVLEVERVEKLLSLLLADLLERLLHGERRARVLGHGIGLNFGLHAIHGVNLCGRCVGRRMVLIRCGRICYLRHVCRDPLLLMRLESYCPISRCAMRMELNEARAPAKSARYH